MKWLLGAAIAALLASGFVGSAWADDSDATAILDKAIKALGGEEKLSKVVAMTWKSKATISFNGNDAEFTGVTSIQGLDHLRTEAEGNFNGNRNKFVTVVNGDRGWRKFGDNVMPMEETGLANEKRRVYLQVVATTVVALKGKDFKVETAGEQKVAGSPAAVLKVTGPDGKEFTLCFDKQSGLPVKQSARVTGFGNNEFDWDTTFAEYKDFDGIKKATKIESKRDGERFVDSEITEFKVVNKLPADTFNEPQ